MLRLGGYLQQQEKLRPSSPVSSFFRGYEAAADRAYKEGASQLARETLEYNKKKQAEDAQLRQETLQRKKNQAKAQAQENALYKYIDDARDGNVPIEQIQQQVNKMYDNSPEYREMLGQPKIQVTNKGRVVMTETGIVTQEKLDELLGQGTIDQDFYDQAVPNIGKEYTFDFARNPQGGFIPIGVKFNPVEIEKGQRPDVGNIVSLANSLLRRKNVADEPEFTTEQVIAEVEKLYKMVINLLILMKVQPLIPQIRVSTYLIQRKKQKPQISLRAQGWLLVGRSLLNNNGICSSRKKIQFCSGKKRIYVCSGRPRTR